MVDQAIYAMARRFFRSAAAVLLVVGVSGCFLPVFDLPTSLAYQTASKMTKVGTVGPINISDDRVAGAREYYFVPSRMQPPNHGLLVIADEFGMTFSYLAPDPSENNEVRELRSESEFFDNKAGQFSYEVGPVFDSAGTVADAYFIAYSVGDDSELATWTLNLAGTTFDQSVADFALTFAPPAVPPGEAIAVTVDSSSPIGNAPFTIFVRDSDAPTNIDVYSGVIADEALPLPPPPLGGFLTSALPNGFFPTGGIAAYDGATNVYIYSNYTAGGFYNVYRWTFGTPDPELLPVRQPIDEILSTGELYHRGANSDEVYDSGGRKRYSIPTGNLHFAYENTDGPESFMIYTLIYWDQVEDNDSDNMFIDIYTIPTADLDDLE